MTYSKIIPASALLTADNNTDVSKAYTTFYIPLQQIDQFYIRIYGFYNIFMSDLDFNNTSIGLKYVPAATATPMKFNNIWEISQPCGVDDTPYTTTTPAIDIDGMYYQTTSQSMFSLHINTKFQIITNRGDNSVRIKTTDFTQAPSFTPQFPVFIEIKHQVNPR